MGKLIWDNKKNETINYSQGMRNYNNTVVEEF